MTQVQQEKIRLAQNILDDLEIPIWMAFSDHKMGQDTMSMFLGGTKVPAMLLLSPTQRRLIVHDLEADNIPQDEWKQDEVRVYLARNYTEVIAEALKELGFNNTLAVDYTTMGDALVDRIGAGTRDRIDDTVRSHFPEVVGDRDIRDVVTSSERILYALYDRKTPDELVKMGIAARRADDILKQAFGELRPGMTEKEAFDLVKRITEETKAGFLEEKGLEDEEYAWDAERCPTVLTGPSFVKGGHSGASDEILQPGNTVYFDFGVKLYFPDGTHFCSDIQRMGYVLRDGETQASEEAQIVFNVLYRTISHGIEVMKPGAKGHEIDQMVRDFIREELREHGIKLPPKFKDLVYNHATGHPLGEESHNPGAKLGLYDKELGTQHLTIQPHGVYTIEPRIPIVNGGSIEEDVVVNPDNDNYTLCPRQTGFYLISGK
ncbi:MAG: M24 family metallopeptidase [archaeon]